MTTASSVPTRASRNAENRVHQKDIKECEQVIAALESELAAIRTFYKIKATVETYPFAPLHQPFMTRLKRT